MGHVVLRQPIASIYKDLHSKHDPVIHDNLQTLL